MKDVKEILSKLKDAPFLLKYFLCVWGPVLLIQVIWIFFASNLDATSTDVWDWVQNLASLTRDLIGLIILFLLNVIIATILACVLFGKTKSLILKTIDTSIKAGSMQVWFIDDENDSKVREERFRELRNGIQKSFCAYGIGLTTLSDSQGFIKGLVRRNIDVRLCMANPGIFKERICTENIKNEFCYAINLAEGDGGKINADALLEYINNLQTPTQDKCKECEQAGTCADEERSNCPHSDLLSVYEVVLNTDSLQKYLEKTNYHNSIATALETIERTIKAMPLDANTNNGKILLKKINSFIPLSITIVDEETSHGQLIVEYILPYSDKRLMLHVKKSESADAFKAFSQLFATIFGLSNKIVATNK